MYKFFAISLTSILMLINVLGPAQPAMAMDDSSVDMNSQVDELPTDDGSDVIVVEDPVVEEPALENEPVLEEEEGLTPEETPDENANSPPADEEEPVVEEETPFNDDAPVAEDQEPVVEDETPATEDQEPVVEDEEPVSEDKPLVTNQKTDDDQVTEEITENPEEMVIAPSAVDPDPNDCPVGEVCDGGGGDEIVEVNVTMTASTGSYRFTTVTYSISDGTTSFEVTSDAYGVGHTKLTKGVTYQVTVTTPEGYGTDGPVSITPTMANHPFAFELNPIQPEKDPVSFKVLNNKTMQPIPGAKVTLVHDRTWSSADSGFTNSDGTWTSIDLKHGNYEASVEFADHQGVYDIPVTIPANHTFEVRLIPIEYGPISLQFVDDSTGESIPGVFFDLAKVDQGNDVEAQADANGGFTTPPLEYGTYRLWADVEGYGFLNDYRFEHPANGTVVVRMHPVGDGTITFNLIDEDSGDPIPSANITMFDADTSQQVAYGQSNSEGQWITPVLPGGYYNVVIHAPEHYSADFQVSALSGNQVMEVPMTLFSDVGNIDIRVVNNITQQELEGVKITIYKNGLVTTGTTDSDGFWETPQLVGGMYTIVLEKPGYFTKTIEHLRPNVADDGIFVELTSKKQLDYRVIIALPTFCYPEMYCDERDQWVIAVPGLATGGGFSTVLAQAAPETEPMAGATVQLLDTVTGDVLYERVTGEDGQAEFLGIWEGDYTLRITAPNIVEYTAPLSLTESLSVTLPLQLADPQNPDNPDEGTNPDTGNPDDGSETPDTGNPDDGSETPDTGTPDDGTENPDTGTPDDGSETPGAATPDDGSTPDSGNPDTGNDQGSGATDPDASASNDDPQETVAQAAGSSDEQAQSSDVARLPNTGAGTDGNMSLTLAVLLITGLALASASVRRFSHKA